ALAATARTRPSGSGWTVGNARGKSEMVVTLVSVGACTVTRTVTGWEARGSGNVAQPGCVVVELRACTSAVADHSAMNSPLGPMEASTSTSPSWAGAMDAWRRPGGWVEGRRLRSPHAA